ncbi:MAG TPA: pyridoxamine 5'-phosphate oxidase family protein [Anaeromyxobacteraceae bacterium]|nr:pyridoxamine 5'-phosphate oxidase family protein [Anaeromyxobacteraceae bacterium]
MQERAGVREEAARIERSIHDAIAHKFVAFLTQQRAAVLGAADARGRVWASLLDGPPGFLDVVDERTLRVRTLPGEGDPLQGSLAAGGEAGLLVIDFATRRRLRLNGQVTPGDGEFTLRTRQVYANCSRYIQARSCEPGGAGAPAVRTVRRTDTLGDEIQRWIRRADTLFITTAHPEGGADASHRGGFPGFVRVADGRTLTWPDYDGNRMFNTIGNLAENPSAGLLLLDFENGRTLQLSGTAHTSWDPERAGEYPGAKRLVDFTLDEAVATEHATSLRWQFLDYSPDNPSVR